MGIARSTLYDLPPVEVDDTALIEAIAAITGEFEAYGWRRVRAALRQRGIVANHKKIRRLMREHDLQPRMRRRYGATTDSNHDGPIFPNLARDFEPRGTRPALAGRHYLRHDPGWLRLRRDRPRRLVQAGRRLRDRPLHRRSPHPRRSARRPRGPTPTTGVHSPWGPRLAVCCGEVSRAAGGARSAGLDGSTRQSV